MELTAIRADYPVTETCLYLDHAAVGPVSRTVAEAAANAARLQMQDPAELNRVLAEKTQATREIAAQLYRAHADRVAFIGNTSHGLSQIANGLDLAEGDNVIVSDHEFPSNYLPWLLQRDREVEIRNLPLTQGRITPEKLAETIDARTRVVAISHVQYHNGFRADIAALAEIAHRVDALLVVDGTQSIGAMTFDLDGWGADALVFSAHKWMLCPKGVGLMLLSPTALGRIGVTVAGWQSVKDRFAFHRTLDFLPTAARFEPGTENAPGRFAIATRLAQIEALGAGAIEERCLLLRDGLAEGLRRLGWQITSPDAPTERSAILTARHPDRDPTTTLERLRDANIRASVREGALRLSPHAYLSEDELDHALEVIASDHSPHLNRENR